MHAKAVYNICTLVSVVIILFLSAKKQHASKSSFIPLSICSCSPSQTDVSTVAVSHNPPTPSPSLSLSSIIMFSEVAEVVGRAFVSWKTNTCVYSALLIFFPLVEHFACVVHNRE
jgi:hypothetical protein